ncbi:hypothetical protein GCM10017673_07430 [Streptosporangium violaceochromogenes]|nr:hypothetical protein GCM10017673_07430 [Streptosporangium violaceochromogenes]
MCRPPTYARLSRGLRGWLRAAREAGLEVEQYMAEHGLRHYTEYHPGSDFWAFQAIESIWVLGLAAVLFTAAVWIVRRRTT